MKLKLLLIFSFSLFYQILHGQSSCSDNFYFRSQGQIDSFGIKYPNCSILDGSVTILGSNITNLDSLYHVTKIKGDLIINYGKRLKSIHGLKNCDSIMGQLVINQNDSLLECKAFNALKYAKTIEISSNKNLNIINDFDILQSCDKLLISGNTKLREISGLNHLTEINVIYVSLNRRCKAFNGFHSLKECGDLSITNNDSLANINAFSKLKYLKNLFLFRNDYLSELIAFQSLKSIAGDCQFSALSYLRVMNEMDSLEYVGGFLQFSNLQSLITLPKFKCLKRVKGSLHISECWSLNSVSAFDELRVIGGQFLMRNNVGITSIEGFRKLDSCLYDFVIDGGSKLKAIDGFDNLKYINDRFTLAAFDLESIKGFQSLHEIRGEEDVDSTFWINMSLQTGKLKSIDDFSNLRKVRGILLNNNLELVDIYGFDKVDTSYTKYIKFSENSKLTLCKSAFLCSYLANPNHDASLSGNAPGCNTREEILASCTTATNEWYTTSTAAGVFPNPCPLNSRLWFTGQEADFHLTLYTSTGQKAFEGTVSNPVNLPVNCTGLYHYRLTSDGKQKSGAVVVME